jgi:hydrogenase expression/formation protein HypC
VCLAIPGQILEIIDEENHIARVDVSGVRRQVDISLVRPEGAGVGSWVLIHVGFALSVIDEAEARQTLRWLEQLGPAYQDELDQGEDP